MNTQNKVGVWSENDANMSVTQSYLEGVFVVQIWDSSIIKINNTMGIWPRIKVGNLYVQDWHKWVKKLKVWLGVRQFQIPKALSQC